MLKQGAVFTPEEMSELHSDIKHMYTPSWLTSVPTNLGKPSHGKLKADQWCTLGTTYLPVLLICLWDQLEDNNQHSQQCKKLLASTLSLISAVIITSSQTTSHKKADLYLHYMKAYLNGLCDLFPSIQISTKSTHSTPSHWISAVLWPGTFLVDLSFWMFDRHVTAYSNQLSGWWVSSSYFFDYHKIHLFQGNWKKPFLSPSWSLPTFKLLC